MNATTDLSADLSSELNASQPVNLAIRYPSTASIDIFRNSIWAGNGYVKDGRIVDCCTTQLGRNGNETEAIYDAIERAIACGETTLHWSVDNKLIFTWRLGDNGF